MSARHWVLAGIIFAGALLPVSGQTMTFNERMVQLSDVLGNGSPASRKEKLRAINEIIELHQISGLASGMLFDRANQRFEVDPEVREAAALGIRHVCDLSNRMFALRLARISTPAQEPEPKVRIAALRSLAAFETAEAAAAVYDAANDRKEPDPTVREQAKLLIQKGLAGGLY